MVHRLLLRRGNGMRGVLALTLATGVSACSGGGSTQQQTPPPAVSAATTPEGSHDVLTCEHASGWVWNPSQPDHRLSVDITDDSAGTSLGTVLADQPRLDLQKAGKGDGNYSFAYALPNTVKDGNPHAIRVRIAGTKTDLNNTPRTITCGQ